MQDCNCIEILKYLVKCIYWPTNLFHQIIQTNRGTWEIEVNHAIAPMHEELRCYMKFCQLLGNKAHEPCRKLGASDLSMDRISLKCNGKAIRLRTSELDYESCKIIIW